MPNHYDSDSDDTPQLLYANAVTMKRCGRRREDIQRGQRFSARRIHPDPSLPEARQRIPVLAITGPGGTNVADLQGFQIIPLVL